MKRFPILFFLVLTLGFTTLPSEAGVMVYKITQDGWNNFPDIPSGGKIIGSFSGEDSNHDGFIDLADNEVTSYLVKFNGSIFTPDFTHTFEDLLFFKYTIGSLGFPPSFPLFSAGGGFGYDADDRVIVGPNGSGFLEVTNQPAFVTRVPEPSTLALMGLGALGLLGYTWRRRKDR